MAWWLNGVNVNATVVDSTLLGGMKYLLFPFGCPGNKAKHGVEFRGVEFQQKLLITVARLHPCDDSRIINKKYIYIII